MRKSKLVSRNRQRKTVRKSGITRRPVFNNATAPNAEAYLLPKSGSYDYQIPALRNTHASRRSKDIADNSNSFLKSTNPLAGSPIIQQQSELPENLPTLQYGSQGAKVHYLQKHLNSHGANIGIDGIFGPETYQAVRQFQGAYAPPVDGIVGPITWRALTSGSKDKLQDRPDEELYSNDFYLVGQNIFEAENALDQTDPMAHAIFGSILQEAGNRFLQTANTQPAAKSTFIPVGYHNQDTSALTVETFKRQLDVMLKAIAVAVDFEGLGPVNTSELLLYKRAYMLHLISQHVQAKGLSPLPKEEMNLFLNRVNLMRDFYSSFLTTGYFTSTPQIEKQKPITGPHASERRRLVGLALSDVGKVRARENPRFGWRHLKQIYDVSFNGKHPYQDRHFQKYSTTQQCAHGDVKCVDTNKREHDKPLVSRDILGSWCGIGAMYWLKIAGQTDLEWKVGVSGLANKLKPRSFAELPQVGDVVINKSLDHHGIISWIDPGAKVPKNPTEWAQISIKTVESNVNGGQIIHAPSGHEKLGYFKNGAFNSFERK